MKRYLVLAVFALIGLTGCQRMSHHSDAKQSHAVPRVVLAAKAIVPACNLPAPTSAAGYNKMFASVDSAYWGGGDVSISTKLPNGLRVWLYGDTLSHNNGFVHSSAIVQTAGCLHVSQGGKQLLPNVDSTHVFWIDSAKAIDNSHISVRASLVVVGTKNAWDFHATGTFKTARVYVSPYGNLTFQNWLTTDTDHASVFPYYKSVATCTMTHNGTPVTYPGKPELCPSGIAGEYSYNPQVHAVTLASGKTLVSVCYNNADALTHFDHYRPRFFEVSA